MGQKKIEGTAAAEIRVKCFSLRVCELTSPLLLVSV